MAGTDDNLATLLGVEEAMVGATSEPGLVRLTLLHKSSKEQIFEITMTPGAAAALSVKIMQMAARADLDGLET